MVRLIAHASDVTGQCFKFQLVCQMVPKCYGNDAITMPLYVTGQIVWDLWLTQWYWDRFISDYFCFSLPVSYSSMTGGWFIRPICGRTARVPNFTTIEKILDINCELN
jgi:hypothetical protein